MKKKYRDPKWLKNEYKWKDKTQTQIANEVGVSPSTISNNVRKHGIVKQRNDEQILHELYHNQNLSSTEIGEILDCDHTTVLDCLHRLEIKVEKSPKECNISLTESGDDYKYFQHIFDGQKSVVYSHRLLAVAKYGPDAVCGMEVHHKNGVRSDNRYENITLMKPGEHQSHHVQSRERTETGEWV